MRSYQFMCCKREEDGSLTVLELKTPVVSAQTPTEALQQLNDFFATNACLPYREVT